MSEISQSVDDKGHGGGHHAHDHAHPSFLQHHFDTPTQQFDTAKLGMWTFIATEVLFFGGLFMAYVIYRATYPAAFSAGSHSLSFWKGTLNTGVLLTSSLTMASWHHSTTFLWND